MKVARAGELNSFAFMVSLECKPSQLKAPSQKSSNWSSCPAMECEGGSLVLGNSTSSGCNTNTCAYAGFSSQTIFTNISTLNTCPGPSPDGELQTWLYWSNLVWMMFWECFFLCQKYFYEVTALLELPTQNHHVWE